MVRAQCGCTLLVEDTKIIARHASGNTNFIIEAVAIAKANHASKLSVALYKKELLYLDCTSMCSLVNIC